MGMERECEGKGMWKGNDVKGSVRMESMQITACLLILQCLRVLISVSV